MNVSTVRSEAANQHRSPRNSNRTTFSENVHCVHEFKVVLSSLLVRVGVRLDPDIIMSLLSTVERATKSCKAEQARMNGRILFYREILQTL